MKYLNAQQLAFLLDIEVHEAREKMVYSHCKANGLSIPRKRTKDEAKDMSAKDRKAYINYSEFPTAISIQLLEERLNIPTLQSMVNDIRDNYLTRNATRKYILSDYPEKRILSLTKDGKGSGINIPPALKTLLPQKVQDEIMLEWRRRYPKWFISKTDPEILSTTGRPENL